MKNIVKFCTLMIVLLVTILSLLVLSLLSFSTAKADLQVATRYAEATTQTYDLESEGNQWLADIDEKMSNGQTTSLKKLVGDSEERHLEIEIASNNGTYKVTKWVFKPKEIKQTGLNDLYKGE